MRAWLAIVGCLPLLAAPPGGHKGVLRVPVWMQNGNGAAPLAAGDFRVKLDGRPARVVAARGPADDLLVLLVLDLSEQLSLAEIAKEALAENLRGLPASIRVAVLGAQNGLRVLVDPTPERGPLEEAIRAYPVTGKAGLLDTIETAARLADSILEKAAVRLVLLYVTDSDVHNYREDFINPVINSSDQHDLSRRFPEGLVREKVSKLEAKLAALEAPVAVVHLDYRSDRLNEAYQAGLMRLAAATGGPSVFCRSRADIPGEIAAAFRAIVSHYSLEVEAPARPPRILPVELESGGRTASYRSRFVFGGK
jgi:Mg-chelatase subunit ChlD